MLPSLLPTVQDANGRFPKIKGPLLGGPYNEDYIALRAQMRVRVSTMPHPQSPPNTQIPKVARAPLFWKPQCLTGAELRATTEST